MADEPTATAALMAGAFRVMRQDDNGNVECVAGCATREEAAGLAAAFEARGHKQLYWVEED